MKLNDMHMFLFFYIYLCVQNLVQNNINGHFGRSFIQEKYAISRTSDLLLNQIDRIRKFLQIYYRDIRTPIYKCENTI